MDYLRLATRLAFVLFLPASVFAAPLLRCEVTYAGATQTIDTRTTSDPYPVASVDIGGRFWFKPVMVGSANRVDYIKLYAYLDTAQQPVLIQVATYLPPFKRSRQPVDLTGTQRLYAGPVERELTYHCHLLETRFMNSMRNRWLLELRRWSGLAVLLSSLASPASAKEVHLMFAGDIVLDDTAGAMIARGEDPFSDFATLFASADIRIGNLECVVATTGSAGDKNFTFRAHPRTLPVLKRHFDAVALANNHSGDFGRDAFAEMLGLLKMEGLAQFGGGMNLSEAHKPLILERSGLRIALLGYNEFMPRSFEADHNAPGVAWSEDERVVADIRRARSTHRADIVIPVMHWGWENELTANPRQRELARIMIDAGADAVIGGHPHVTQDIDIYRGKPIVYSVGNFVMKETDNDNQRRGWVLHLRIDTKGIAGFATHAAQLDMEGIPRRHPGVPSPCWKRGAKDVQFCP